MKHGQISQQIEPKLSQSINIPFCSRGLTLGLDGCGPVLIPLYNTMSIMHY